MCHRILALSGGLLETIQNSVRIRVTIIHRTVRTYLESNRWNQILDRARENIEHAEVLWLRVCARSFSPSFNDLLHASKAHMHLEDLPQGMSNLMPTPDWGEPSPPTHSTRLLHQYSAMFMLEHAKFVEEDLVRSSYPILHPVLTKAFLKLHLLEMEMTKGRCPCHRCAYPLRPLHLAISHRLDLFVSEYLNQFFEKTSIDSPEWNGTFYFHATKPRGSVSSFRPFIVTKSHRLSLLEFTLWHVVDGIYLYNLLTPETSLIRILKSQLEYFSQLQQSGMGFSLYFVPRKLCSCC